MEKFHQILIKLFQKFKDMKLGERIYTHCGPRAQSFISRWKYTAKLRPRVNRQRFTTDRQDLYPERQKASVIFSADLELAWGWCRAKGKPNSLHCAMDMAHQTRLNFPTLLSLFENFEIPVTWATVGHLFLDDCSKESGKTHPEVLRPPYFTNAYWSYTTGDWFDMDAACHHKSAPEWYAPDLIKQILDSPIHHEIGCHSFSHIDLSDRNCPYKVAESDLNECVKTASAWGIELRSFVFPGNLAGNMLALKKYGFFAYRMNGKYELDYPQKDSLGLWKIPGGICIEKPFPDWSYDSWVSILKRYIDVALETGTVCHFWFHPSVDPADIEYVFQPIVEYLNLRRENIWLTTMLCLTKWLEQSNFWEKFDQNLGIIY